MGDVADKQQELIYFYQLNTTEPESRMMKDVTILLTLFLHLFNQFPNVGADHNLLLYTL